MKFRVNESTTDRIVRVLVGAGLLYFGYSLASPWNWVTMAVGVVLLLTGLVGYCVIYDLLKIKK
ncbi:MAG TPA: DUF2892 domain-containing protein [Anaerolineales bacterium]|nr:DUF2892 domain-containing protein [Anaerolineales bacterium]